MKAHFCKSFPLIFGLLWKLSPLFSNNLRDIRIGQPGILGDDCRLIMLTIQYECCNFLSVFWMSRPDAPPVNTYHYAAWESLDPVGIDRTEQRAAVLSSWPDERGWQTRIVPNETNASWEANPWIIEEQCSCRDPWDSSRQVHCCRPSWRGWWTTDESEAENWCTPPPE